MERLVEPEIIDQLPPDHPDVIRSRRDLRMINFLMGNERWIARNLRGFPEARARGVIEIGAGEGTLLKSLACRYPGTPLAGCDLAPRPATLSASIEWYQQDVFECLADCHAGVLAANLFLHHFTDEELPRFAPLLQPFEIICVNEPYRTQQTITDANIIMPLVGRATKHDMPASIRAGFLHGEMPRLLGLDDGSWRIREQTTWRGGIRMLAWRN
jgi:2-polyprenyl-3-methyl-5-hydroxy-6-metoxy-1,4-benzoquinol methylase